MTITKPQPEEEFKIKVSAETMRGLKLYQQYKKETCGEKWESREVAEVILSAAVREADSDFLAWCTKQGLASKRSVLTFTPNGAPADA